MDRRGVRKDPQVLLQQNRRVNMEASGPMLALGIISAL